MVMRTGCRKWSRKEEILSVMPPIPLTIGLIDKKKGSYAAWSKSTTSVLWGPHSV